MNPVERHQDIFDKKTLSQFEIEERVQDLLPSELVNDYKKNRRVPHIPEEQRIKKTPAREQKWTELATKLAATLTGKNKQEQEETMAPQTATLTAEAIAAAVAKAMKAITVQQEARAERIKQPDCFHGERSATVVDGWLRAVERYTRYYNFSATKACEFAVNLLQYNWMGPYIVVDKNFDKNIYKLTTMEGVPYTSWVHADRLKIAKSDDFDRTWYHPTAARNNMRRDLAIDSSSTLPFSMIESTRVDRGRSTVSRGGDVGHYFDESEKSG
ncbi:hypothetical protein PHYBLDRAFT_175186 [Phycomyces blakesleeanus NRRL 1555(-)]|uniref:Uncharacterized protein n=1 Tax=Phycomyces blakesleeanus (strain ATCC 8743b / DSM 1359 / FGSC 10004 / NBRC 33097 / NRRL 1555) TaxID=763407 RepID=A0A162WDF7_PHYB8|nr:hypothetical protein PHYBLDRAFT_175186 [Phycomyces blakesleeanus NRRL 1555(-)]OAD66375.1 hypothetical protein PHYBLDRAFT_175186 [Phycomyces blakesleeanus NRRL 1555(-)]|eukprot:XP_018284415.1 hypothetical protein PHYBLDRAFT_175186 [Phycomyces blakesleeanus NRRL 1555(-)]